jgi:mRNA-degrading endonuclease RelE of RelBE toxin-antitoxin system
LANVVITTEAAAQFDGLPVTIRNRVLAIYERLAKWPQVSGAKPLKENLAGHYRIRTGDYRVQFYVSGDSVIVEKIGHRDGFYDEK